MIEYLTSSVIIIFCFYFFPWIKMIYRLKFNKMDEKITEKYTDL